MHINCVYVNIYVYIRPKLRLRAGPLGRDPEEGLSHDTSAQGQRLGSGIEDIYVSLCVYIYIYIYMYLSLYMYIHMCIYIYIYPEVLKSGSALILRAGSYF